MKSYRVKATYPSGETTVLEDRVTRERADLVKRALNSAYKDVTVEEMPDVGLDTIAELPAGLDTLPDKPR
ncbi:MAG TPA: hypothetical protein VGM05_11610 [Planctomycetaceae bacterium]|jgi:hypothetical protein